MKTPAMLVVALLAAAPVFAADEAKPAAPAAAEAPKPAEPAAATPAAAEKVYAPTDLEGLKAAHGQKVVIEGTIAKLGANKNESIRYLNFTEQFRDSISLVFFASSGGGAFTKEKLTEYLGKKVRVNGTVSLYQGSAQIKIESLDQLKIQP